MDKAPLVVPTEFSARRLVTIQWLRGIAALMVVLHHVLHQSPGFLAVWSTEAGQAGVDLFFVISGFVMVFVTHERERSPGQFLAMRAVRIIPVYWFFTLAAALMIFSLPRLVRSTELSVSHIVFSLLFIPHQAEDGLLNPIIKQGWTLNYEAFYYVLFALAIAIWASRRVTLAVGALTVLAAIGYWMEFTNYSLGTPRFYFNNIILEFALGMLIARAFLGGKLGWINSSAAAIMVVTGFIALFALDPFFAYPTRVLVYGIPAAIIVIGALAFEGRSGVPKISLLEFTGDASYSIYLVHIFPIVILRAFWPLPMHGVPSFLLFLIVSVTLAIGMGAISYYSIEQTSLKYLRKKIRQRAT